MTGYDAGMRAPPSGPPELEPSTIVELCRRHYFEVVRAERLDGYQDATFRVETADGGRYVFKAAAEEPDGVALRFERRVLQHLEGEGWSGVPRIERARDGRRVVRAEHASGPLALRVLSWLDGVPLADLAAAPDDLLRELGGFLGRLDTALASLDLGEERRLEWDLARLDAQRPLAAWIEAASDRRLAESAIDDYLTRRRALLPRLRRGPIHNDANDHNVLVGPPQAAAGRRIGLIDFGDVVVTETVHELAVAMAYAGMGRRDPWSAALPVALGYDAARRLSDAELELLPGAVRARLALSVSMAAARRHEGTADAYALVSERAAWAALRRLGGLAPSVALDALREVSTRETPA